MPLEDPEDPLDDIASRCVTQVKQLLGVVWTRKNVSQKYEENMNNLRVFGTTPFRQIVTSLSYFGIAHLLVLMFRLYLYYRTYLGLSRYLDP
jgi:hypothetical protein